MSLRAHVDTPLSDIEPVYDRLQTRFASHVTRSLDYRMYNLKQLAYLIKDNEQAIFAAMKSDLDESAWSTNMNNIFPALNEIDIAVKRLAKWMKDEGGWWDSTLAFSTFRPRITKVPKGVALIIGPWNYPWLCMICPMVGAIAAGCPVVLKPSELAPASAALLADLIPKYLDPQAYAVVLGGQDQTTRLLEKEWGHILFTGSGRVGKIVAGAAAKTLTPSTLELGGKSPVIVSSCADVRITARRLMSIKQLTIGQMCICPDYVLCAKDKVDEFIAACTETLDAFFPPSPSALSILHTQTTSAFVGQNGYDRQLDLLEKAQAGGKVVYRAEMDRNKLRMGISIVKLNENADGETGGLIEEEIFGPVLPIIPVPNVDAAIRYINSKPKPLALYVASRKRSVFQDVLDQTTSGSALWNDFALAALSRSTPFGGVGASGWGSYHGRDGFNTFTHNRSTIEVDLSGEFITSLRYPPVSNFGKRVLGFLLSAGVQFSRPVSVEHEKLARVRRTRLRRIAAALGLIAVVWLGVIGGRRLIK